MNKKAFTLIELLAVIVVLSILALLTSTAVTKMVKDSKNSLSDTQMQLIESAAKTWTSGNPNKLPDTGTCGYITLRGLYDVGLLSPNIIDPKTNEEIDDELKIKISVNASSNGNPIVEHEINPEDVADCYLIYVIRPCGDVNNDARINQEDSLLVAQYATNNRIISEEDFKYADVNGDGTIDPRDRSKLNQYVGGASVTLSCNLD